jgi:hypothetical protein
MQMEVADFSSALCPDIFEFLSGFRVQPEKT